MEKKNKKRSVQTGGGDYFEGKVEINGDFVHGNKVFSAGDHSVVAESIQNSRITMGASQQSPVSVEEMINLLETIRGLLLQTGMAPEEQRLVEADLETVKQQLSQPEPKKHLVLPKLESLVTMIGGAAKIAESWTKIQPLLIQAVDWVKAFFAI